MGLLVVALVAGCCGDGAEPMPDAGAELGPLDVAVGEACEASASYFCARYEGVCAYGVCRAQCREGLPRCGRGEVAAVEDLGRGVQCYCVP